MVVRLGARSRPRRGSGRGGELEPHGKKAPQTRERSRLAVDRYREDFSSDLARCGLLLAAAVPLGFAAGPGPRRRRVGWVVPLVLFADLADFGRDFNGVIEPAVHTSSPRGPPNASPRPQRPIRHPGSFRTPGASASRVSCPKGEAGSTGTTGGCTASAPTGPTRRPCGCTPAPSTAWRTPCRDGVPCTCRGTGSSPGGTPGFLSLANVRFVVTHAPLRQAGLRLLHEGDLFLYENSRALPQGLPGQEKQG